MGRTHIVPLELIEQRIYLVQGEKVMLSTDLAHLYQVPPRALVQAVKRNIDRFPGDFMFQLTRGEFKNLKSHIVTSSWGDFRRAAPYAFTEQGVAMLSSVLKSKRAVQVNQEQFQGIFLFCIHPSWRLLLQVSSMDPVCFDKHLRITNILVYLFSFDWLVITLVCLKRVNVIRKIPHRTI